MTLNNSLFSDKLINALKCMFAIIWPGSNWDTSAIMPNFHTLQSFLYFLNVEVVMGPKR